MQVEIHAFSFGDRSEIVETLTQALESCGSYLLDRRLISEDTAELQVELRLRSALEFYSIMQAQGLQLTRLSHRALGELCTLRQRLGGIPGRVVSLRLELQFLEAATMSSILATAANPA